ncbi:MAG TPA: ATP-dependent helicase [Saprospiraceae bacterium]|nr:ATP-dependent helicase [Saprospiraceae bacterium]
MPKQSLSPEQKSIVDQWLTSGEPMLVEASAGSGKTRVLTESVRRIIEDSPKSRSKILCLTFTNKAAEEMQERLKDLSKVKDRTFIGTTHAFALDIIKSRRHELGMDEMPTIVDKESDRKAILTEAILSNPLLSRHYLNPPPETIAGFQNLAKYQTDLLDRSIDFISGKKQKLVWLDNEVDSSLVENWRPGTISLFQDYNDLLRNQNLIDYDDIILLAWKILNERPAVANLYRRIYEYVMIDEAQDLNFAQYEFVKALCGDSIRKIMMVGDANQAIHGYAGASSKFMKEEFVEDFRLTETQKKKIQFNYRSSEAVIKLANELAGIRQNTVESYYEGTVEFHSFDDEESEANWVLKKLHEIIGTEAEGYDGKLTIDKVAILGRNRFVFSTLIEKLKFFLKKGTEVLDPQSTTMKVFDLGTRVLCNQRARLYHNQLIDILDIPKEAELSLGDCIEGLKAAVSKSNLGYIPKEVFDCLVECWQSVEKDINRFPDVLKKILETSSVIEEVNEKDLLFNDVKEWEEAWGNYVRSVPANSKSISDFRRFLAMGITKAQSQYGLTLATVHTVKGLEYYVVFLIGMGQGTFPDYRAIRKGDLEEEKNNAYVAVTRAKRELYISYPMSKSVPWGKQAQDKSVFFRNQKFQYEQELRTDH